MERVLNSWVGSSLVRAETLDATILDVSLDHIGHLYRLPDIHRDPFDRMLIAQAMAENLTIVTSDSVIAAYPVKVLW